MQRFLLPFLIACVAITVGIKLYSYPHSPASFNQDEVSSIVESYSLLTNGTDRWGNKLPMYFESWGTGQNTLYAYLSVPAVKLFGLNEYSMRFVQLIAGLATLLLVYLISRQLQTSREISLFLVLVAGLIDPLINFFTWGLEAQLLVLFWLLLVYSLTKALAKPWWLLVSSVAFTACLYSYGLAILWVILPALIFINYARNNIKKYMLPGVSAVLLMLPFNLLFINFLSLNYLKIRLFDSSIFGIFTPQFIVTRLQENASQSKSTLLVNNFGIVLSGVSDGNPWFTMIPGGMINIATFTLLISGLYGLFLIRKRLTITSAILASSLLSLVASMYLFEINSNRLNVWFFVLILLSGVFLTRSTAHFLKKTVLVILSLSILSGVYGYFVLQPEFIKKRTLYGVTELIKTSTQYPNTVYVTRAVPINYVYPIYALKQDIKDFIQNAKYSKNSLGYYDVISYKQYVFNPSELTTDFIAVLAKGEIDSCASPQIIESQTRYVLVHCDYWISK